MTTTTTHGRGLSVCALLMGVGLTAFAPSAHAQVPALLPVQGTLTDAEGTPLAGRVPLRVALYDVASGGSPFHLEVVDVTADEGRFSFYVGATSPLDITAFRTRSTVYLGIAVGADQEMAPRTQIGSVPYAFTSQFADHAARADVARDAEALNGSTAASLVAQAVPSGAVMFFNLTSCPLGWTEFTVARGRALVGLPAGGMRGATVGTGLSDREDRAHSHSFSSTAITSTNGAHGHVVDPPAVSVTTGASATRTPATSEGSGLGSGSYAPASRHNHVHSVSVDIPATTSVTSGAHSHSVTLPSTDTATTSSVMPYIQLLVCQKL